MATVDAQNPAEVPLVCLLDDAATAPDQILRAFASAFDNQEIAANFTAEISDMAKTTGEIKKTFEEVSRELHEFDQKGYKKKDGSDVGTLRLTWEGYYADYKILLNDSRKDARELKTVCDGIVTSFQSKIPFNQFPDYIDIVLEAIKDKSVDTTELRSIAENYKRRTEQNERMTSDHYAKAFGKLSRDLKDFTSTIANALHDTKDAFDDQILGLEERIAQLQELIRKHWTSIGGSLFSGVVAGLFEEPKPLQLGGLGTTLISMAAEMGFGVVFLLSVLAPIALAGVVGSFFIVRSAAVELLQNNLMTKTLQTQLTDLKSQRGEFTVLETKLDGCKEKINSVATTVGAFGEFWNAVNLDAQILLLKLSAITENDEQSLWELRRGLSARFGVGDIYIALRKALLLYAFTAA